ncbi:ABC transporter permease [Nocardiopsis gilva YIM 90087]|uniref:ABC transporter permease n=1 Tax=Nocardiopsis gilva YIM 90087 TaxID=1235441 RepID=A0A223SBK8_9ACTN|nr:ABC transporter permease [Nocardiopsis gilva]ASU85548.1 ABC transporter permease [Nocardiopsis gilva YIM 90087]
MRRALRAWWAPWRASLRAARRDALRNRGTTALIASMIALTVLGGALADIMLRSAVPEPATFNDMMLGDNAQARIAWRMPGEVVQDEREDLWLGTSDDEPPDSTAAYESDLLKALPPGTELTRTAEGPVAVRAGDRRTEELPAVEADLDAPALAGLFRMEAGRVATEPGEVVVNQGLARRLEVEPGDAVELVDGAGETRSGTVTGVYRTTLNEIELALASGTLLDTGSRPGGGSASPVWYSTGSDAVTWEQVLAVNELGASVVSRAVVLDPPLPEDMPIYQGAPVEADAEQLMMYAGVLGAGLLVTVLLIAPAFAVGAQRSARRLAVVSAQGGSSRDLRRMVLSGALVVGPTAAVAGALLATAVAAAGFLLLRALGNPNFPNLILPWADIAAFALFGVAIAVIAAWLPARKAGRMDPVAVLTGRRTATGSRPYPQIIGVLLVVAGGAAVTAGIALTRYVFSASGIIVIVVGTALCSGAIVSTLGRVAARLPLSLRIALRDSARNRSRTVPAIAAVFAALTFLVATAVFTVSEAEHEGWFHFPRAAEGTVLAYLTDPDRADSATVDRVASALTSELPATDALPVRMMDTDFSVAPLPDPNQSCPFWAVVPPASPARAADMSVNDVDCAPMKVNGDRNRQTLWQTQGEVSPLVDDGSVVRALGLPEAAKAAAALAEGKAVVTRDLDLWSDDTARVAFLQMRNVDGDSDGRTGDAPFKDGNVATVPAVTVDWPSAQYELIIPPTLLKEWGGEARTVGLVAPTDATPGDGAVDRARAAVAKAEAAGFAEATGSVEVVVERDGGAPANMTRLYALISLAAVVAVGASWVAVGLAATDARPEMATLAAVGAAPSTRRRVSGAQGLVITATGVGLGLACGLALGVAQVLMERHQYGYADESWSVVVPWPLITLITLAIPIITFIGATTAIRPHIPLVRRATH